MAVEGPNSVTYGSVSNHDVEHDASDMRIELTGSSMKSSSVGSMDYDNNRSQVDVCNGDNSVHRNLLNEGVVEANHKFVVSNSSNRAVWRRIAIQGSLVVNVVILLIKFIAYIRTLSLSVLAALVDSLLDVVSQVVLYFAERHAKENHSSAMYPAGASRMEPIGVLTCAALMGIASFEVLQESINSLFFGHEDIRYDSISGGGGVFSLILIVVTKLALLKVCNYAAGVDDFSKASISQDSTLAALALDHWNDALSNSVAVVALIAAFASRSLWFFDPIGAILISLYIIHSWFSTGKEMIEQLIGKAAPEEFIDEIVEIASKHDSRMSVDVCRAYHFGPKFLAELVRFDQIFKIYIDILLYLISRVWEV